MSQTNSSDHFNTQMSNQPKTLPNQAVDAFQLENLTLSDGLVDPVEKCKRLFGQLKSSLQLLLNQLIIVMNPTGENLGRNLKNQLSDNQFQLLGQYIENFYRVCDLLIVNLRMGCESQTISNELKFFWRYYAHIGQMDANRAENPHLASINIQTQRINELNKLFQNYLNLSNQINSSQIAKEC